MTDQELLTAWAGGDKEAADQLLRRYVPLVHRFFHGKIDGDAEDLVQRTFTACVQRVDRFRGEGTFRAYLLGIARYELLGELRSRRRRPHLDPAVQSLDDVGPRPSAVLAQRQELQLLRAALRRVPLDLQLLVELRYWEGLDSSEIAAVLEVPRGTVRSRLHRARSLLAEQIREVA
ncbi:MAG: sigma-70 family RNA polymerase sigma factor, partial [Deltaproteobacteria bacterium]|nr:sigma-70 family RNA polymerase sigma factor [Deltaproteobacteria bacterium]